MYIRIRDYNQSVFVEKEYMLMRLYCTYLEGGVHKILLIGCNQQLAIA